MTNFSPQFCSERDNWAEGLLLLPTLALRASGCGFACANEERGLGIDTSEGALLKFSSHCGGGLIHKTKLLLQMRRCRGGNTALLELATAV